MPTNYPAGLDDFTNPTGSQTLLAGGHAALHSSVNDAIEAIEAALGVNPAGLWASTVDERLKLLNGVNVKDHGAEGEGITDDTLAIIEAAAELTARGGGRLVFPPGIYRVFSTNYSAGLPVEPLVDLQNLVGVEIVGYGATLLVDRVFAVDEYAQLIQLTSCIGVRVAGLKQEVLGADSWAAGQRNRGSRLVYALGGCRQISLEDIEVDGGVGFQAMAASGAADAVRTIGVSIRNMKLSHVAYGISCAFSGDFLDASGVESDLPHRSYFVYGVKNHRVSIISKNQDADDCIVGAYEGYGCENIEVSYTNVASTGAESAAPGVAVQFGDQTPATMRGLEFKLDLVWAATGFFGHGLKIVKYDNTGVEDTVDRGHVISGLKVSGKFRGGSAGASWPVIFQGTWGVGETFEGFSFSDIVGEDVTSMGFTFDSLVGKALVSNVVSSGSVLIRGSAAGVVTVVGCKALSLCASAADATFINYYDCEVLDAVNQSFTNKMLVNTVVDGTRYAFRPLTRPSLTYSRTGESVPEAQFRASLGTLGLISDDTVA